MKTSRLPAAVHDRVFGGTAPLPVAPVPERTANALELPGLVDSFGFSAIVGGWVFVGWMQRPAKGRLPENVPCTLVAASGLLAASAGLMLFERGDLDASRIGLFAVVPLGRSAIPALERLVFRLQGRDHEVRLGPSSERLEEAVLCERARRVLTNDVPASKRRAALLGCVSRPVFAGSNTLASLSDYVGLEIDLAMPAPDGGIALQGWMLHAPGMVRELRVRSGPLTTVLDMAQCIRMRRDDVISSVGAARGFTDPACGFIAYCPQAVSEGDALFLEVELLSGEVGYVPIPRFEARGLEAIRRLLDLLDLRYDEVNQAFDQVLGPLVRSLNEDRLRQRPATRESVYGTPAAKPRYSLVIPLYGRVDFLEYQMAIFSRMADRGALELIYVLDDPRRERELLALATSVYERFRVPFRVLLHGANLGFAPASNTGLRAARAPLVCFMNSDVLPIADDWLDRLAATLAANRDIGVIGPRLLFDDGSVQHEGCYYERLPEFGNWTFIGHHNKGRRPEPGLGVVRTELITGACMLMRRSLANELGGFDEAYVIGDFEDSDLCRQLAKRGLTSAVDRRVEAYHIERQSQGSSSSQFRMNLTLYNAWVHERRWFGAPS